MSKRKYILAVILLIFAYCLFWIFEPFSIIPFSDNPFSKSKNQNNLICKELSNFSSKADGIINSAIKKNDFLGISTGVYSERCGMWTSVAGFLNKRNKDKPNKFSQFRIASITKPMTAVAIFQLYEKGALELDIPIQHYLPEFPKKEKGKITIRQLLNHKSGIRYYEKKFESVFQFDHYNSCIESLDKFKDKDLAFEPGSEFLYSSYGYTILGAIIEKVSGKKYQDYMREYIWSPSNMNQTTIENKNQVYRHKPGIYLKQRSTYVRFPQNDLSFIYSAGGVQSTANDLLKFGEAILNFKLISPETTKLMIDNQHSTRDEREYFHGWQNWKSPKLGNIVEHGGKQIGCSSFFRIYFDKKVVAVALANNTNSREEVRNLSIELSYLLLELEGK